MDVSVIVVSYNSWAPVAGCLESLRAGAGAASLEAIVVDNASCDGTPGRVRERFPWVRVEANDRNLGYARGVNQGIGLACGRYALVLNPDITVEGGAIERLVRFMDATDDAGLAASKLLNPDGTLQYSCRRFYTFWTLLLRRSFLGRVFRNSQAVADYLMLDYDHAEARPVDWVIGACMMARREALRVVGLMDERFFLYFEDVDWCYRMWQAGWKVYYVPASVMRHCHVRASARPRLSRQVVAHAMSLIHFYEKWGKAVYDVKRYRRVLSGALLLISDLVAVNASFFLAYALRSSMRGLFTNPMFGVAMYAPFIAFANIVFALTFAFLDLYGARAEREAGPDLAVRVLRGATIAAVVLMASTFLASQAAYSRLLVGVFCILVTVLAFGLRMALRAAHAGLRAGEFDVERMVIVGTGPTAQRLAARVAARRGTGYQVAGFVESGRPPQDPVAGAPVIGRLSDLPALVERQRISHVIFSDPDLSGDEIADFLLKARRTAVDVRMVSGLADLLTRRARVEEFFDLPVIAFEREALLRAGAGLKRVLDAATSSLLLVVWSPALAVSALAALVRRAAPLEQVERAGLGGRSYRMFVLPRTARPSALRRFAVRHGLTRLPALLNVVRGEMSLIGPAPAEAGSLDTFDARERLRFDARPGIASPSQLSGSEAAGDGGGPAALDAYYVQDWSLGGDLRLLLAWLARCAAGRLSEPGAARGGARGRAAGPLEA